MPAPLLPKQEVLERLTRAFRANGYEGATLARLSEATGLVRASLYHHFPGGKEEMARAVLDRANIWLEETVLTPLRAPGDPRCRLIGMTTRLRAYYGDGRDACLLGMLSFGSARDLFQAEIKAALIRWIDAIGSTLSDAGIPRAQARERAEDAVTRVQGALVMARGLNTTRGFERLMRALPDELLQPQD